MSKSGRPRGARWSVMLATGGAVLALAACNGPGSEADGRGNDRLRIAVVAPDVTNATYWASYATAMKKAAEDKGVELVYQTGVSADDENTRVQQVASQNPDGMILVPQSTQANAVAVKALADSSIPLVTSNQFVDAEYGGATGNNPRVHVGFDDFKYGQMQGEMLVDACEDKDPCKVVELDGQSGTSPQIQRHDGMMDVAGKEPNIEFLTVQTYDWDRGKAISVMSSILASQPEIDVVYAQDDAGALGAAVAEEQVGRGGIKNIGGGGSEAGVAGVKSGDLYGLIWVSPEQDAGVALDALIALIEKRDPGVTDNEGRPTVPVDLVKVTADNVDEYPAQW